MSLLHRLDAQRNMARFYAVLLDRSLFGDFFVVRVWGRVGTRGQSRADW
jgi:predicted DNA-binding WGR domain protein